MPAFDVLAVTMTGELCDCFETRREGVRFITDAVEATAGSSSVWVWLSEGTFARPDQVRRWPLRAAASNWLALATFAGRFASQNCAILLDIGSTTTDIIPLLNGSPVPVGRADTARLRTRELVYTGVRRTPLCALLCETAAAEVFATTRDAYVVLGDLPEDPQDCDTANGRPATKAAAHARLARMLCADSETCPEAETLSLAEEVRARQVQLIQDAVRAVSATLPCPAVRTILSGSGEFLARRVCEAPAHCLSLAEILGSEISTAACAYAVAVLAAERPLHGK
jgi:probable H4MPT-linked C1 transfer pathway protein